MVETTCQRCGYRLSELPASGGSIRCPECGVFSPIEATPARRFNWRGLALALISGTLPAAGGIVFLKCVDLYYLDFLPPIVGGIAGGLLATLVLALASSRGACGVDEHSKRWKSAIAHVCWLVPLFVFVTFVVAFATVIKHRSYC